MNLGTYKYIFSKIISEFMIYNFLYIEIDMDIFRDREMNWATYQYTYFQKLSVSL